MVQKYVVNHVLDYYDQFMSAYRADNEIKMDFVLDDPDTSHSCDVNVLEQFQGSATQINLDDGKTRMFDTENKTGVNAVKGDLEQKKMSCEFSLANSMLS